MLTTGVCNKITLTGFEDERRVGDILWMDMENKNENKTGFLSGGDRRNTVLQTPSFQPNKTNFLGWMCS